MTLYIGGGIARNKLINRYSKIKPDYFVELDKDLIWISDERIPQELQDSFDDIQSSSSIEDYFDSRDVTINQVLYSEKTDDLIASKQAIKDAKQNIVRQQEFGVRAALRAIRFASILGWKYILLDPMEYLMEMEVWNMEWFEFQVSLQFARASQSGKGKDFLRNLKKEGVYPETFSYHRDLLPGFMKRDPYDDIKKFDIDILHGIPQEYHHMIDAKKSLKFLASRLL